MMSWLRAFLGNREPRVAEGRRTAVPVQWDFFEDPPDPAAMEDLATSWGVVLPNDYLDVVRNYHGGQPFPPCFTVGRKETVFAQLLPLAPGKSMTAREVWEVLEGRLPPQVFPFAEDPFGNLICFDYRNGGPTVVLWNHELEDEGERALTYVASSLSELLSALRPCGD